MKYPQAVTPEESARLLQRQYKARIDLARNPYAYLLNTKWKRRFRNVSA